MGYLFGLSALACLAIVSIALAEPIQPKALTSSEIARALNRSKLEPADTLDLLQRQQPDAVEAIYGGYTAMDFVELATYSSDDCGDAFLKQRARFYETFKGLGDNSLIFANLNRFCDITLQLIEYTCSSSSQAGLLTKDAHEKVMWFTAEVERYLENNNLDKNDVIWGQAGDVMRRMYPRPCFGGAEKRDYCLKLIKQVESLTGQANVPPPRYLLAYEVCKQWRAVQRAITPV